MTTTLLLVVLTVAAGTVLGDADPRRKAEEALREKIFTGYNKEVLPQATNNITIDKMEINNLVMYEEESRLDVHCWFKMMWDDPRLMWEPSQYDNISQISVDNAMLWIPDLTIYNGGDPDHQQLSTSSQYRTIVYSTGKVLRVPSMVLTFNCVMDLTYWPNDQHNCTVKIGSWVLDGILLYLQVDFQPDVNIAKNNIIDPDLKVNITEWEVSTSRATSETVYYPGYPLPYMNFKVSLFLRRNAPAFNWMVKAPIVCLTLLSLVVFLVPTRLTTAKVTFGGLLVLFDLIFLIFASDTISNNPSHTPLLVRMVVVELVVVSVSVLVSGLVAILAHSPSSDPLPTLLKRPTDLLARLLCLQSYASQASEESGEVELGPGGEKEGGEGKKAGSGSQWFFLAAVVDRLALLCYVVLTIAIFIAFSCVL